MWFSDFYVLLVFELSAKVHPALVKRTSDHCKTVEFPMKACWKEDAQAVASEPQEETVIENVHNFCIFYKALLLKSLWN